VQIHQDIGIQQVGGTSASPTRRSSPVFMCGLNAATTQRASSPDDMKQTIDNA